MSQSKSVIVVGSGVIGLTTALFLSEKGYKVQIIASHFPDDPLSPEYTSPWAGAHFRPFPSKNEKEFEESQYTRSTLKYFEKLAVDEPQSSVKFVEGVDYLEEKGIYDVNAKGYHEGIEDLKELGNLPGGVQFGGSYKTWVVNPPVYLQYLQRKLIFKHGVVFHRAKLTSLKQVGLKFPSSIIVNASGLGLLFEGGYDPQSYKIRGQTLLVRAPHDTPYSSKTVTRQNKDGSWSFVIKRPLDGGYILGGTKQIGDSTTTPKEQDTAQLIANGKRFYPELLINGEFDIKKINVGFRPARNGGTRVELEKVEGISIVHAYGCGGMGYELSYGIAQKVYSIISSKRDSKL